jgi:hypothetical protein
LAPATPLPLPSPALLTLSLPVPPVAGFMEDAGSRLEQPDEAQTTKADATQTNNRIESSALRGTSHLFVIDHSAGHASWAVRSSTNGRETSFAAVSCKRGADGRSSCHAARVAQPPAKPAKTLRTAAHARSSENSLAHSQLALSALGAKATAAACPSFRGNLRRCPPRASLVSSFAPLQ